MELIEGHLAIDPPVGVPVWDIDPYDEEILADPNAYYAELRDKGPFAFIPKYGVLACGRYNETKEVFSDHERFVSSRGVGLVDFKYSKPWRPASIILEADPPEHTHVRRIMAKVLSPKVMREHADLFQTIAAQMVADVISRGSIEAASELAELYPTTVFPQVLGMKDTNAHALLAYGAMVFDAVGPDNEIRRRSLDAAETVVPWIMECCRRDNLTEGALGQQVYERADAGDISPEQAMLLVRSLLSAGVDTTVTGIGSLLFCLAENPDQWEHLKQNPALARQTFEEVLRYTSPVHSFCRTANEDTEVSGVKIPEGAKLFCVLGAANRDPDRWPNPNKFDITRDVKGHLGMGAGVHGCVGQNLARAEVGAVLAEFLKHGCDISFDGDPVWRPGNSIRALAKLPVKFSS
ncbi:MAG: cytochrome P450 [Marivita sp.]